jgi:hypothetical protein
VKTARPLTKAEKAMDELTIPQLKEIVKTLRRGPGAEYVARGIVDDFLKATKHQPIETTLLAALYLADFIYLVYSADPKRIGLPASVPAKRRAPKRKAT